MFFFLYYLIAFIILNLFIKLLMHIENVDKVIGTISFISAIVGFIMQRAVTSSPGATQIQGIQVGLVFVGFILLISLIYYYIKYSVKNNKEIQSTDKPPTNSHITNIDNFKSTNSCTESINDYENFNDINSINTKTTKLIFGKFSTEFVSNAVLLILAAIFLFYYLNPSDTNNSQNTVNKKERSEITLPLYLPPVSSNMSRVVIPQVGTIDIDNSMEVQNEAWRQSVMAYKNELGIDQSAANTSNIVIQQKGLENYCRIIVETITGNEGDYEKLTNNYTATKNELDSVSQTCKNNTIEELNRIPNMRILEWYPARLETINGMTALVISYRRQLGDNPPVLVWEYRFQNYDRLIMLHVSYREIETDIWKPIISKSMSKFRITNIRQSS